MISPHGEAVLEGAGEGVNGVGTLPLPADRQAQAQHQGLPSPLLCHAHLKLPAACLDAELTQSPLFG